MAKRAEHGQKYWCKKGTCCRVYVWPSLTPVKDKEVVILAGAMTSRAFGRALHHVMRTLIDDLSSNTFNVTIFGIDLQAEGSDDGYGTAADSRESTHSTEASTGTSEGGAVLVERPVVARCPVDGLARECCYALKSTMLSAAIVRHMKCFAPEAVETRRPRQPHAMFVGLSPGDTPMPKHRISARWRCYVELPSATRTRTSSTSLCSAPSQHGPQCRDCQSCEARRSQTCIHYQS
jgi:hypothetical protein